MTQRPSGSPNAGRINCFPTKTSQPILSQSILSQPILSHPKALLRPEVEMTHERGHRRHWCGQSGPKAPSMEVRAVVNVRYWHKADMQTGLMDVRFQGNNGHDADVCAMSAHDP